MKTFALTLTVQQIASIEQGLHLLPYGQVHELMAELLKQITAQREVVPEEAKQQEQAEVRKLDSQIQDRIDAAVKAASNAAPAPTVDQGVIDLDGQDGLAPVLT